MKAPTWASSDRRYPFLDAIDFAVDELGMSSFASLDNGSRAFGEQAFYAMDKPTVREGALADVRPTRARDQLLNAIELAHERPGLRVVDGDGLGPAAAAEIGEVDGVFLLNVLLHAVAPDWDQVLELYAPATSCFVIGQPQWEGSPETVRLHELGRERYLEVMPPAIASSGLIDRLDDLYPGQMRPMRDARTAWQWGITDADMMDKLGALGFDLVRRQDFGPFQGTTAFSNRTFVFRRV